ncbi:MAG TPA: hypothetical protein VFN63_08515, partial [Pseudolabrys sp.]|nr:hypothetical protein [Pseudolabrys sp.]
GGLFAVECFRLAVDDGAAFFMTICAVKALEPSLRVRPIIVPMVRHDAQKYDIFVPESARGQNEPETVRHETRVKVVK